MIDKQLLQSILVDRLEVIQKLSFIPRETQIEDEMPSIVIGIRRCGKSYLLYQKMFEFIAKGRSWDEFLYMNFEDERLTGFEVTDFQTLLDAHYSLTDKDPILFLDEIQNIQGWEKFARRMADEKRLVFITGSNASMLSSEMEASLGGRYLTVPAFTYSFEEFLRSKEVTWTQRQLTSTKGKAELLNQFQEYLSMGGFPEITKIVNKRDYLSSIYQKIFLGDIIARYNISNVLALEVLMKKLAETVRHPISFSRLNNIVTSVGVNVGKSTTIQYIEYVKEAQLIFQIQNFASKLTDKITTPKYYYIDNGLLHLFLINAEPALLENLAAIQLIRMYGKNQVYYYQKNIEVDFYVPKENMLIQVCYSLSDIETRTREITALQKANQFLNAKRNIILTYDQSELIEIDGIKIEVIPMWQWLLKS